MSYNRYPQRSGITPLHVLAGFTALALGGLPFYGDKVEEFLTQEDSGPTSESDLQDTLPPYGSVTGLDHQTVHNMKNDTPREEQFTMEIDGITYAWPVGRPDFNLYQIALPCELDMTDPATGQLVPNNNQSTMCHGDTGKLTLEGPGSTYAMDFVYRDVGMQDDGSMDEIIGEPVRAITDGTIIAIDPGSDDPSCSQIKLQSIDGHVYWNAHLAANPPVSIGQQVVAGQEIAEVGGPSCGGGTVPHGHQQRMRPGETNASYDYTDRGYIDIITQLYIGLYQKSGLHN